MLPFMSCSTLSTSKIEALASSLEEGLAALGFSRAPDNALFFYRSMYPHEVQAKIEVISLRFEYDLKMCRISVSAKFPRLIEFLAEVLPFTYIKESAWAVPDYLSHIACMVRLQSTDANHVLPFPTGVRWQKDGKLRCARSVPVERLGAFLSSVIQHHAMSVLEERLNLAALATASSKPGYEETGIAGAWALAARLALKDFNGVEDAFRKHPYSLGVNKMRFEHAKTWLLEKGFLISDVNWSQEEAQLSRAVYTLPWLTEPLI